MKQLITEIVLVFFVLVSTVGITAGIILHRKSRVADKIELLARAPEKGNWFPMEITVDVGKEANILIRNVDTASHGFYLPEFDVDKGEIRAGEVKNITFIPDKKGRFPFYCSIWCGDYHMQMRGTLIVK